jgi:hypothetical protein
MVLKNGPDVVDGKQLQDAFRALIGAGKAREAVDVALSDPDVAARIAASVGCNNALVRRVKMSFRAYAAMAAGGREPVAEPLTTFEPTPEAARRLSRPSRVRNMAKKAKGKGKKC